MQDFSKADAVATSNDAFACCSKYEECSATGICPGRFITNERGIKVDYSINCAYRKNLEKNQIFFGKNASEFSPSTYSAILEKINALDHRTRRILDALVVDFCEYHRAAHRLIVRNDSLAQLSDIGFFQFSLLHSSFPRRCGFFSYLRPQIADSPLFRQAQAKRKAELAPYRAAIKAAKEEDKAKCARLEAEFKQILKATPGETTQEFMVRWLNNEAVQLRDFMAEPYRLASRRPDHLLYLEEYYRDALAAQYETRIYPLSPFAEDGLLSVTDQETEELRRVKLSPGYSAAEKARRVAEIEAARAERKSKRKESDAEDDDEQDIAPGPAGKKATMRPPSQNLLLGKTCAIIGDLISPPRSQREAFFAILKCGGNIVDTPDNSMDILILGDGQTWSRQRAENPVLVLSEAEFNEVLKGAFNSF